MLNDYYFCGMGCNASMWWWGLDNEWLWQDDKHNSHWWRENGRPPCLTHSFFKTKEFLTVSWNVECIPGFKRMDMKFSRVLFWLGLRDGVTWKCDGHPPGVHFTWLRTSVRVWISEGCLLVGIKSTCHRSCRNFLFVVFLEAFGALEAVRAETITLHLKCCVQLYSSLRWSWNWWCAK